MEMYLCPQPIILLFNLGLRLLQVFFEISQHLLLFSLLSLLLMLICYKVVTFLPIVVVDTHTKPEMELPLGMCGRRCYTTIRP